MDIKVIVQKYNGELKRSWTSSIETQTNSTLVLFSSKPIYTFPGNKQKKMSFDAREYYFFHQWFNVFELYEKNHFNVWYINIASPPDVKNNILKYKDYDLDFVVHPNYKVETLDQDEFDQNKVHYPKGHIEQIAGAIEKMHSLIHNKKYPFILPNK